MRRELDGRVALITGASSGIGEAATRALARRGYDVVLAARRLDRLQAIAQQVHADSGVRALPIRMDVADQADIQRGVTEALDRFGRIDVVINDAGLGHMGWLEQLDPLQDIDRQIRVNLLGAIQLTRCVLPHMQAARKGHLIFVASLASYVGTPTYTIYAASKFGLRGFCQALRREVSIWGIRVSTLYPATVRTGFASESVARRKTGMTTPGALVLTAEAVGDKLSWLATHPRRTVVMPSIAWAAIAVNALAPGVIDGTSRRFFVARERQADVERVKQSG